MLHFLFSLCGTGGDTAEVERKEGNIKLAFEAVQQLVNKEVANEEATKRRATKKKATNEAKSPLVEYLNRA